jgi:hypothetical protein
MEIRKNTLLMLVVVLLTLTGCGKSFTDYSDNWVSSEKNIKIDPNKETAIIDYPEIDQNKTINILSNGRKSELHFCYGDKMGDGEPTQSIWDAHAVIKGDKLYLEITEDRVTDLKGKTIVLEQSKE